MPGVGRTHVASTDDAVHRSKPFQDIVQRSRNFDKSQFSALQLVYQIFRGIHRDDPAPINNDDAAASLLHFRENVRGKNNGVVPRPFLNELTYFMDLVGIQSNGGLVQYQNRRIVQQRLGETDPLFVTLGQTSVNPVSDIEDAGCVHDAGHFVGDIDPGHSFDLGDEAEVTLDCHFRIEWRAFREVADAAAYLQRVLKDIKPIDSNPACRGREVTRDGPHRRSLSRTVGTEEAKHLAGLDGEADVGDRCRRVVTFGEILNADHIKDVCLMASGPSGSGLIEAATMTLNSNEQMKNYSTLIFDAFDTVIHIDRERLPRHNIGEAIVHTTAPKVYEVYTQEDGELRFEEFVDAFLESSAEAYRRRKANLREIPSADRFRIMLELLEKDVAGFAPDFPERLAETHMEHFGPALEIRPENHQLLEWALQTGYRLAMISNFDYSPTLYQCLERHALRDIFEVIAVSDELGWRKPHPKIFNVTLKQLEIAPADALFIGDRLDIDVDGAAGAGLDSVWIDTGVQEWTPQHAQPQYTIGSLSELRAILEGGG